MTEAIQGRERLKRLLLAAPVYLAAAALLVIGVYLVGKGLQPGVNVEDSRPTDRLVKGLGALFGCFCLANLGYFATKANPEIPSLVTTAGIAFVAAAPIVAVAAQGTDVAVCLVLVTLFVYPGVIALVRIFGVRRGRLRQQSPRTPM